MLVGLYEHLQPSPSDLTSPRVQGQESCPLNRLTFLHRSSDRICYVGEGRARADRECRVVGVGEDGND